MASFPKIRRINIVLPTRGCWLISTVCRLEDMRCKKKIKENILDLPKKVFLLQEFFPDVWKAARRRISSPGAHTLLSSLNCKSKTREKTSAYLVNNYAYCMYFIFYYVSPGGGAKTKEIRNWSNLRASIYKLFFKQFEMSMLHSLNRYGLFVIFFH